MRFSKMQGIGNDFVVVDAAALPPGADWPALAVRLCVRRFGVGADGLLSVERRNGPAAIAFRMFNPDGTEDMCGNGLRCVGLWAKRAGWLEGRGELAVETQGGPRAIRLLETDADLRSGILSVDMGLPRFAPDELPFCAVGGERIIDFPLTVGGRTWPITVVNTGSTHTVIFTEPLDDETFQRDSPLIETHPLFPERTSILWASPSGASRFQVRIWERGAGETLGCGTGACAVAVAASLRGLTDPSRPTEVISKGGALQIAWPAADVPLTMTGPATFVFEGEIDLAATA